MIADIVTTKIGLTSSFVHEVNGFMGSVVQNDFLFIGVKAIGTIIILLLYIVVKSDNKWGFRGRGIIVTLYTFVLINNLYWIMRSL